MINLEEIVLDNVVITFKLPYPSLTGDVWTVCDMLDLEKVEAMERVLDASPIVKAKKIDDKDPPRNRATSFSGVLTHFVNSRKRDYETLIQSTSGGRIPFETMFQLRRAGRLGPVGKRDCGYSCISLTFNKKEEFAEYDICEFKSLFNNICLAVDAFYGRAGEHSMVYVQREVFMAKAAEHPLLRRSVPDFNRELWDVYWLNYFGNEYVRFWGEEKVLALSREYELTRFDKGGICVQTTPEPVFADDSVKGIKDYAFKKHMYEILGYNTFMHETQQSGKPGQYVPTLDDQRRFLNANLTNAYSK